MLDADSEVSPEALESLDKTLLIEVLFDGHRARSLEDRMAGMWCRLEMA